MSGFSAVCDTVGRPPAWWLAAICAFILVAGGVACAPDTVTIRSHPHFAPGTITKVAIAPFRAFKETRGVVNIFGSPPPTSDDSGRHRSLRRSVPPAPRLAGVPSVSVPPFVPEAVRHMVYSRLTLNPHIHVVPPDTVGHILLDADTEVGDRQAQILGQRLAVDAVLEGMVRVYREREGTTFAAIPAAVGFELRLLGVRNGEVLWVGEYFEEQKPLTQDVRGFFGRGGLFVTAEALARDGVVRVLQRLPLGKE